jgi:hypothetical protein
MRTSFVLIVTSTLLAVSPAAAGDVFVEISGRTHAAPGGASYLDLEIETVRPVVGGAVGAPVRRLDISCPGELGGHATRLAAGDVLRLSWETVDGPSRGWLWFGGSGGRTAVRIPGNGIPRICRCAGSDVDRETRLTGVLVMQSGREAPGLIYRGRSEGFFRRLLPFWKGNAAKPPSRLTVRLGWHEEAVQEATHGRTGGGR